MNNFSLKIKNKLKLISDFLKINPHRHWIFLLYVFFVLNIILIIFSLYLLYEIKNEQIFQIKIDKQIKQTLLKDDLLKKVTDLYDAKAKIEQEIKNKPFLYSDPSF